ncbi:hypothetical protein [Candidatus Palauibacter sp.]|uniref:hypothetical protein n=1 Tax=Candidatus Palauibacter sp. TaxID=3101350 RepID=UPI003B52B0E5
MSTGNIVAIVAVGISVLGGLYALYRHAIKTAEWRGEVNADRTSFKEFMQEVRLDIKTILGRLAPNPLSRESPLRLNDLGKTISTEIEGAAWADRIAGTMEEWVESKDAYEIQEYCFEYAAEFKYSDEERRTIRKSAYKNGLRVEQVHRVLAIELRNKLLALASLDPPS